MAMMLMFLAILSAVSWAAVNGQGDADIDFDSIETLKTGDKCETPAGEAGMCKEISTCEPYVKREVKYNALRRCAFIGDQEITCCPTSGTDSTPSITTKRSVESPASSVIISRNEKERPSEAACRAWKSIDRGSLPSHTADGITVAPGDYPHMGRLIFPAGSDVDINGRCGALLISERYVLSSAPCVEVKPIMVRFGVVVWNSTADDSMVPVDAEIGSILILTESRPYFKHHDIGLIKLRNPVEFTSFVRPACLYADKEDFDSNVPLEVIGWSGTDDGTQTSSEVLLKKTVRTVPFNECNATHLALGDQGTYKFGLKEGHYCTIDSELKKDACQADPGSILQLFQDEYSTVIGVASFDISCGTSVPSVYVRIASHLESIESLVWP